MSVATHLTYYAMQAPTASEPPTDPRMTEALIEVVLHALGFDVSNHELALVDVRSTASERRHR